MRDVEFYSNFIVEIEFIVTEYSVEIFGRFVIITEFLLMLLI